MSDSTFLDVAAHSMISNYRLIILRKALNQTVVTLFTPKSILTDRPEAIVYLETKTPQNVVYTVNHLSCSFRHMNR